MLCVIPEPRAFTGAARDLACIETIAVGERRGGSYFFSAFFEELSFADVSLPELSFEELSVFDFSSFLDSLLLSELAGAFDFFA